MRIRVSGGRSGAVSSPALPPPGSSLGAVGLSGVGQGFALFFRKFSFRDSSSCSERAGRIWHWLQGPEGFPTAAPSPQAGSGFMEAAATYKIAPLINLLLPGSPMPEAPVMPGTDPTAHRGPAGLEGPGLGGATWGISTGVWRARLSWRV